ncbi:MAG: hypothetical protein L0Y54_21030, partial [Sporichthyaceae bacterium]|nr:hypothetical protein [Sporichthyaceae bacterium]
HRIRLGSRRPEVLAVHHQEGTVAQHARAGLVRRLLGAVMLGVATLLIPKVEPDQHWSDPPVIRDSPSRDQARPEPPTGMTW